MKNQQNNTDALSALLRTANGGDTLETDSLCCSAAGIIAPPSATTEALIPHEKLRGALPADATLNAQERPLAQPAVGYELVSGLQFFKVQGFGGNEIAHMGLNLRKIINRPLPISHSRNVIREDQLDELHDKHTYIVNMLQKQHVRTLQTQDIQPFDYIQRTVVYELPSPSIRAIGPTTTNRGSKQLLSLLNQISKLMIGTNHTLYFGDFPSSTFILFHHRRNNDSNEYCENRADSLNPTRSVLRKPSKLHPISNRTSQKPKGGRSEHQIPKRPDTPFNHPIPIQHHQWLLAIKKRSMTKSDHLVHLGGKSE